MASGRPATTISAAVTLEEVYRAEYLALVRMAATVTQSLEDAQDVVHDAFVGLQRHWGRLRERHLIVGYLRVAVLNQSRSLFRRRATARRHLAVDSDVAPAADAPLLQREEYLQVAAAVRRLPRRQFLCVALRYWSDMTDTEIASALGVSPVAVRSNVSRGLRTVADQLEASR